MVYIMWSTILIGDIMNFFKSLFGKKAEVVTEPVVEVAPTVPVIETPIPEIPQKVPFKIDAEVEKQIEERAKEEEIMFKKPECALIGLTLKGDIIRDKVVETLLKYGYKDKAEEFLQRYPEIRGDKDTFLRFIAEYIMFTKAESPIKFEDKPTKVGRPITKIYCFNGEKGCRSINVHNGKETKVYQTQQAGFTGDAPWTIICPHGRKITASSFEKADLISFEPHNFCPECHEIYEKNWKEIRKANEEHKAENDKAEYERLTKKFEEQPIKIPRKYHPITKQYNFNGEKGCVVAQKNQNVGAIVKMYQTQQAGFKGKKPWTVICAHGSYRGCVNLHKAIKILARPETFCVKCNEQIQNSEQIQNTPITSNPTPIEEPKVDVFVRPVCHFKGKKLSLFAQTYQVRKILIEMGMLDKANEFSTRIFSICPTQVYQVIKEYVDVQ
jgi:hypothetical protein